LNYVHQNPVKHGYTQNAEDYRWCSMAWFVANALPGFGKTVFSFRCDQVKIRDEF